ncbi:hypothetical protein BDW74DRAFT_183318 [Aspergillus multicolor]|uniref:uncharacterized protein n=1 Tax=Aspergillus multicolor TaxID=41759 RepID=UPI003CCE4177
MPSSHASRRSAYDDDDDLDTIYPGSSVSNRSSNVGSSVSGHGSRTGGSRTGSRTGGSTHSRSSYHGGASSSHSSSRSSVSGRISTSSYASGISDATLRPSSRDSRHNSISYTSHNGQRQQVVTAEPKWVQEKRAAREGFHPDIIFEDCEYEYRPSAPYTAGRDYLYTEADLPPIFGDDVTRAAVLRQMNPYSGSDADYDGGHSSCGRSSYSSASRSGPEPRSEYMSDSGHSTRSRRSDYMSDAAHSRMSGWTSNVSPSDRASEVGSSYSRSSRSSAGGRRSSVRDDDSDDELGSRFSRMSMGSRRHY